MEQTGSEGVARAYGIHHLDGKPRMPECSLTGGDQAPLRSQGGGDQFAIGEIFKQRMGRGLRSDLTGDLVNPSSLRKEKASGSSSSLALMMVAWAIDQRSTSGVQSGIRILMSQHAHALGSRGRYKPLGWSTATPHAAGQECRNKLHSHQALRHAGWE